MSVNLLLIVFVLIVIAMIAFILVQKGAGATAGSAFGSGASSTVFGAKGSGNFLTKTTMALAFLFFGISLLMAVNASKDFTTAATGEVDLGVIGKLDTSTSDVPSLTPAADDSTKTDNDIPAIEEKIDTAGDVPAVEAVKEAVTEKVSEIKDTAVQDTTLEKVEDLKQEAVEKAEKVKD